MKNFSNGVVRYDADQQLDQHFRTGVSLHSQTMHSRE